MSKSRPTIYCFKVLLRFIMQFLRFFLQLLEPSLRIYIDGIFCVLSKVEFLLESLGSSGEALLKALETHVNPAKYARL